MQTYKETKLGASLDQRKDLLNESLKVLNLETQRAAMAPSRGGAAESGQGIPGQGRT